MKIREVLPEDDRREIAQLIYGTDPYIYPFWLDGVTDKLDHISRLIDIPGSVFHHDNLLVAELDGRIIGVFGYLHTKGDYSYDYHWESLNQGNFEYVFENYFGPTVHQAKTSPDDVAVILNVCITPEQRGKGYGGQMFSQAADLLHAKGFNRLVFDCLADNDAALQMYLKSGCKTVDKGYGFNGFDPKKPPEVVFLERHF